MNRLNYALIILLAGCGMSNSSSVQNHRAGTADEIQAAAETQTSSGSISPTATGTGKAVALATANDGPTSFACNAMAKPAIDQIRALTRRQYLNTVADLITAMTGSTTLSQAVLSDPTVAAALNLLPANMPTVPLPIVNSSTAATQNAATMANSFPDGGWLRADQSIQQTRVNGYFDVSTAIAQVLTSSTNLTTFVGHCATAAGAASQVNVCLAPFLQKLGPLALRRPFNDANHPNDMALYTAMFLLNGPETAGASPASGPFKDVIIGLLNAPELLYFIENDPNDAAVPNLSGVYQLSGYELASRLSYHIWDTMPDQALFAAAADNSLMQPAVYQAQVDRMFADPRAQQTMDQFFADYLQTENAGGPRGTGGLNYHNLAAPSTLATANFQAFAGSALPTTTLYPDMVKDAVGMLDYYTKNGGTVHDLLTSQSSFATTADVSAIYGLRAWDGTSTPPTFPAGERPGLFTRALFTSAGLDTSPILKGVYLRRYVLCDMLGPPPPSAAGAAVAVSSSQTTRQSTEAITSVAPCSGCHASLINPLGFATESFDGLGRYRTQQPLYSSTGSLTATLPINTAVTPYVMLADAKTTTKTPADLMSVIDNSGKPAACIARNYFRYTFARFEDTAVDACALQAVTTAGTTGTLADMWKAITMTTLFTRRTAQ